MNGKVVASGLAALGLIGSAMAISNSSPTTAPVEVQVPSTGYAELPVRAQEAKPAQANTGCDPNYSGCLNPNASDYDCAGGSGNGPYFTGPVQVYGRDHFGLDRDGDGWACE
jgi:hypothetical protein